MGLNRYFTITAETKNREAIYDLDLANRAFDAIDDRYGGWEGNLDDNESMRLDGVNWYDVYEDMIAVSKEFPEIIFCVWCEGSALDDIWAEYFCDGRVSGGNASIPDPDYDYLLSGHSSEKKSVMLTQNDINLICEALNNLAESRREEIKWAGDDQDLITADTACIDAIAGLIDRL